MTDLGARWDGPLTYHPACHLRRGIGVDRQPRLLLATVRGAEIRELPEAEDCCGFGGIFSIEHPELSAEFLKRKIGNLEKTEATHAGHRRLRLPDAHRRRVCTGRRRRKE